MRVRDAACLAAFVTVSACAAAARPDAALTTARPTSNASVTVTTAAPTTAVAAARRPRHTPKPTPVPTPTPAPLTGAQIGGCPLFPADNAWRTDISGAQVDPNSNAYVASISIGGSNVHPDFGSNKDYGIPYTVVPSTQKMVPIKFTAYGDESDPGPYPIPNTAKVEAGGDKHVLVVRQGECKLYELYVARKATNGWKADSGAVFDLRSNALRPAGWTSADAAGLPILPGLVRRDEIEAGKIEHALRFTAPQTQRGYVSPARHFASSDTDPSLPPMGLRLRLKSSFNIDGFHGASKVVLQALKTYGMILADNGSSWYISGANDTGWNDDDLNQLKSVPGSAFEAVQHGAIEN